MTQLADLFPGYESKFIKTSAGKIFARIGGTGAPLMLLHGYPQSNAMWHRLAPLLDQQFTLVIPDLPGYGQSDAPESGAGHAPYDKRSMARAMGEVMDALGHEQFRLAGHDRGGRVAYRLALDHPAQLVKLCTLDIVPTYEMWARLTPASAMKIFHWTFLAQPFPLPEKLIGHMPVEYLEWKISSWNGENNLSVFDPRALEHYRTAFSQAARLHASCEDYRAGATTDRLNDEADKKAGKKIQCPLLALWGESGIPSKGSNPLDIWREWANDVSGGPIQSGHFLAEENPADTTKAMLAFFG
jgi:haloacetate dehalogenase